VTIEWRRITVFHSDDHRARYVRRFAREAGSAAQGTSEGFHESNRIERVRRDWFRSMGRRHIDAVGKLRNDRFRVFHELFERDSG
jgi:hypothetical protein